MVDQPNRRGTGMTDPGIGGPFNAVAVVTGAFDHPWIAPMTAARVQVSLGRELSIHLAQDTAPPLRGKKPPDPRPDGAPHAPCG